MSSRDPDDRSVTVEAAHLPAEVEPCYEIEDDDGVLVATVEVTNPTVVPMGDWYAYRQITYTAGNYMLTFEVRDGSPGCVKVEVVAGVGESYLRSKDLAAIKINELCIEAFALFGVTKTEDGRFVHRLNYRRDRQRVEHIKTRRRTMTPDLIARVAQIHDTTPEGSRIAAIRAAFNVAERQALRYIAQARKDGLIKNDDAKS
jgi:hypothetical protein